MRQNLILIAALSLFLQPAFAWAKLKVGDPAPRLSIAAWVKGEPVSIKGASEDEVFIIEFWATWCGPCKAGMPHLSEMQEHFRDKGVTFVGVTAEKVGVVKKFMKSGPCCFPPEGCVNYLSSDDCEAKGGVWRGAWDEKMRYTVAVDDRGQTNRDWMAAAEQRGIPCAFVVKGGKIKWIGHPASGLDAKIAALTKDTKYAKNAKKKKALKDRFTKAVQASNWKKALAAADKLIALDEDDFTIRLQKFRILSKEMDDGPAARSFGRELIREWQKQDDLCKFAKLLLHDDDFAGKRDVKLAVAAAKKAAKLSKTKDPVCLKAYAMALAEAGNYKRAVKWQKKAVKLAKGDAKLKTELKKTLKKYKKKLKAQES